jgi:hypothetical protein
VNRLNRSVPVVLAELVENGEYVCSVHCLLSVVGLQSTDDCDVCPTSTDELRANGIVEVGCFRAHDREVDAPRFTVCQRKAALSAAATPDDCPRNVVECSAKVCYHVAEARTPGRRPSGDRSNLDSEAVPARVVVSHPEGWEFVVRVCSKLIDLTLKRVSVDNGLPPFEPCAIERFSHRGGRGYGIASPSAGVAKSFGKERPPNDEAAPEGGANVTPRASDFGHVL